MKRLILIMILAIPAHGEEFSRDNLRKTLESITVRAKQAEAAAAAAEQAAAEAEKGRTSALGYVAEISNANARLDAELLYTQTRIDGLSRALDESTHRANALDRILEREKTATAEQGALAWKWRSISIAQGSLALLYILARTWLRSLIPFRIP